jgi:hypothetical protein
MGWHLFFMLVKRTSENTFVPIFFGGGGVLYILMLFFDQLNAIVLVGGFVNRNGISFNGHLGKVTYVGNYLYRIPPG